MVSTARTAQYDTDSTELSLKSSGTPARLRTESVDAYRGLVMALLLGELWRSCDVSAALPDSRFWRLACFEQTHAAWVGASLHDLIQPSFYFLVGVGLLFSMSHRRSAGQTVGHMLRHVMVRAVVLVSLGVFLQAIHPRTVRWVFDDTLSQIGLAYPLLFFIATRPRRQWTMACGAILLGYWLWFALSPLPPPSFDYAAAHVSPDWLNLHGLTGFGAHWQKNSNVAFEFDRWFLNLFPQEPVYVGSVTGLTTMNFVPSTATMILGLIAGDLLRSTQSPWRKVERLCLTGLLLVCGGWGLGALGISPVVKAIWTPGWVLFSGGWCFLLLAAFYALVDAAGLRRTVFPLTVVGMNSLVAYAIYHIFPAFAFNSLRRIFGAGVFEVFGAAYEPFLYGCAVFAAYWSVLYLLYRRKTFVRV
jgi:predicted acyltransferase